MHPPNGSHAKFYEYFVLRNLVSMSAHCPEMSQTRVIYRHMECSGTVPMEDSSSAIPSHLSDVFEHHELTLSVFGFKTETDCQMHVHIFPYIEVVVSMILVYLDGSKSYVFKRAADVGRLSVIVAPHNSVGRDVTIPRIDLK